MLTPTTCRDIAAGLTFLEKHFSFYIIMCKIYKKNILLIAGDIVTMRNVFAVLKIDEILFF